MRVGPYQGPPVFESREASADADRSVMNDRRIGERTGLIFSQQ